MCCRFLFGLDKEEYSLNDLLERKYLASHGSIDYKIGEIFPSEKVIIIKNGPVKTDLEVMSFGYKEDFSLVINAKSETVKDKSLFADDFKYRRGALLINGFFEWDKSKNKFYFHKDNKLMYLAIIYNLRKEFVILTQNASEVMSEIHNRQPVILNDEEVLKYIKDYSFAQKIILELKNNFIRASSTNNYAQFIND